MTSVSNSAPLVGTSLDIVCTTSGMTADDIIWSYFPTVTQFPYSTIYIDQSILISRFTVTNNILGSTLISTLTISNVSFEDGAKAFQCTCNAYKTCI